MTAARRLVVRGRVQGVGFRWFVREAARAAGASGWVRNHPDGSVEVLVAGLPAAVDAVERAARRGPDGAAVESVEVSSPEGGTSLPHPFTVLR